MTLTASPRREERYAIRADIRVTTDDMQVEAIMVDISCHGLGTDALMHFAPQSAVRVDFPDGSHRMGTSVWRDGFWSGILFDTALLQDELGALVSALTLRPQFSQRAG